MWFRQLESESINSWNMLVARFIEQFRVHIARPKNVMSLTTIKQRPKETLRSFLERFNVAAASVDRPEPSMVLMAAVSGVLDNSEFKKSLYRDPPRNLSEFYLESDSFCVMKTQRPKRKFLMLTCSKTENRLILVKAKEKLPSRMTATLSPGEGPGMKSTQNSIRH